MRQPIRLRQALSRLRPWPVVSVSPLKLALARRKPGSAGFPAWPRARLGLRRTFWLFWCVGGAGLVVFVGVRQPIRLRHAVSRLRLGPWSGDLFKPAVASTGRGASRGNPLAALGLRAKSAELPCLASRQTRAASGVLAFWCVGGAGLVVFVGVRQAIRLRHAVYRLRLGPWSGDFFKPAVASTGRGASRGNPLAALGLRAKTGPPRWWRPGLIRALRTRPSGLRGGLVRASALGQVGSAGEPWAVVATDGEERGRVAPFALEGWFFHSEKERKTKSKSQDQQPRAQPGAQGDAGLRFGLFPLVYSARAP